jgi:hypothetical protein
MTRNAADPIVCHRHGNPLVRPLQRKLCEVCRAEIRERRQKGASLSHLARQYGVVVNAVWRVCRDVEPCHVSTLATRAAVVRELARRSS